jgi:serine/threonine protein kinase
LYSAEIILAIEHLHMKNIVFRDLKPENVLLDAEGHIALTDFGLSKEGVLDWTRGTNSFCGSVAYLSPEILNKTGHGKAVDWYLLGVMIYEMLVGIPPFYSKNRFPILGLFSKYLTRNSLLYKRQQMIEDIKKGPLKFPKGISEEAKSLMTAVNMGLILVS